MISLLGRHKAVSSESTQQLLGQQYLSSFLSLFLSLWQFLKKLPTLFTERCLFSSILLGVDFYFVLLYYTKYPCISPYSLDFKVQLIYKFIHTYHIVKKKIKIKMSDQILLADLSTKSVTLTPLRATVTRDIHACIKVFPIFLLILFYGYYHPYVLFISHYYFFLRIYSFYSAVSIIYR